MDLSKRLNDLTNIAILLVVIFVGVQFVRIYGKGDVSFYKPGDTVRGIPQGVLGDSPRALLIQVNSTCAACDLALPFYQRVIQRVREQRLPLRILAVTTEEPGACAEYLRENSIVVDKVISPEPTDRRLKLTPTLVVVDSKATVVAAWAGKIQGVEKQREVARAVGLQQ